MRVIVTNFRFYRHTCRTPGAFWRPFIHEKPNNQWPQAGQPRLGRRGGELGSDVDENPRSASEAAVVSQAQSVWGSDGQAKD